MNDEHGEEFLNIMLSEDNLDTIKEIINDSTIEIINFQHPDPTCKLTALMACVGAKDSEKVKLLVQANANLELVDASGKTALMIAIINKKVAATKILIEAGANIHSTYEDGTTLLMQVVDLFDDGKMEITKLLLEYGASVDAVDDKGRTVLMWACSKGLLSITKIILHKSKSNVNTRTISKGESALMLASQKGDVDIVNELIQAKADLNTIDKAGKTALIHASEHKNAKVMLAFVNASANTKTMDNAGHNALYFLNTKWSKSEKKSSSIYIEIKTALTDLMDQERQIDARDYNGGVFSSYLHYFCCTERSKGKRTNNKKLPV